MRVFVDPEVGEVTPLCAGGVVAAIGFFDGVHRGHQQVFSQVVETASETGACSAVVTFDPHPAVVLRPENAPSLLSSHSHKLELFAQYGFDLAVVYSFDETLAALSPEAFVERLLVEGLTVQHVVVGDDFHFGAGRSGNVATLRELGAHHGFAVAPVALMKQQIDSQLVSSTNIRRALAGGNVELAKELLGRPHELRGEVVHGDKRGREIGFPTANLGVAENLAIPADGVYAGFVKLADGSTSDAAINIGKRPTFHTNASESLVEAHLIDFEGDLYGQQISVCFNKFLRSERRFNSLDELKAQLAEDVARVAGQ